MSIRTAAASSLFVVALVGCGGDKQPPADLMQHATAAAEQMSAKAGPPIKADLLNEHLPSEIVGLPRVGGDRQDASTMGIGMSTATASYRDGTKRVSIRMIDMGAGGAISSLGAVWALTDIDRRSDDGFERTTTIDGHRAFEKVSRQGGRIRSELAVIAANRLMVTLEGNDVELDELKRALDALDLASLLRRG
ncbi:MAG: hypothetical protein ACYC2K_09805 [Gemmatimonadales bacterium]